MQQTKFCIIIPTRQRLETLTSCLDSCLSQKYDHLEVKVLVNASPDTEAYLAAISDPRLKYYPSEQDLPMRDNWERLFDIGLDPDTYVMFLGDDDALMPDALTVADAIVRQTGTKIVSWAKAEYCWPTMLIPSFQNFAYLPLSCTVRPVSTQKFLEKSHAIAIGYDQGPSIYASFVRMELLQQLRAEADNTLFRSGSPDVYSSYILSTAVDNFMRCDFPLSINGASKHSNGINYMNDFESDVNVHFSTSFAMHPSVTHGPSVHIAEADALLRARDAYPHRFAKYSYSIQRLVDKIAAEITALGDNTRAQILRKSLATICKTNGLQIPKLPEPRGAKRTEGDKIVYGFNPSRQGVALDMARFGVSDVSQAARLMGNMDPLASKIWLIENRNSDTKSLARRIFRRIKSELGSRVRS